MKALMYHYVRPRAPKYPYLRYLHFDNFCRQLDWLTENFGFVSREDFLDSFKDSSPRSGVILTFDDGFSDHYEYVLPELLSRGLWGIFYIPTGVYQSKKMFDVHRLHLILGRYGGEKSLSAALNIVTDEMLVREHFKAFKGVTYIGLDDDAATLEFKRLLNFFISYNFREAVIDQLTRQLVPEQDRVDDYYISREQIRKMHNDGMVIGAHTVNHKVLSKLTIEEQKSEISGSFNFLSDITDLPIETFCYPHGGPSTFTPETEELLTNIGCKYSFTVEARDISSDDLAFRPQALPRYDCNQLPYGEAENN